MALSLDSRNTDPRYGTVGEPNGVQYVVRIELENPKMGLGASSDWWTPAKNSANMLTELNWKATQHYTMLVVTCENVQSSTYTCTRRPLYFGGRPHHRNC